jgi:hypothetical protein
MSNIIFPPTPPSVVYDKQYEPVVFEKSDPDSYLVADIDFDVDCIPPEFRPRPDSHTAINKEQNDHLDDYRASHQLSWFRHIRYKNPPTYYSTLAPVGIQILEIGHPAQTGPPDSSPDFLFGNCRFLEQWLLHGTGDKLFLLRDPDWFHTRPVRQGSTILQELRATSSKPLLVEVQELGKEVMPFENCVEPMPIDQVISRFFAQDPNAAPLNLLSLQCQDDGVVPWPLAKHCNLLNQAAAASAASSQSALFESDIYATAGKQSTDVMSKFIDLQSCIHFMIFGQAGAISSWHMDAIGPYTWITLEPNAIGNPAEHVLKLWAYVRTDHLSVEEQEAIRTAFIRDGGNFQPPREHIRVLSLVAGDTLIMPPGTIHAPITITDCLFRGGMVMQKREMRRSIQAWRFCSDNGGCTNENQPRQSRAILDYFGTLVKSDPAACGYRGVKGFSEFEKDARTIGGESLACKCKGPCVRSKCGCAKNTQRCGHRCHGGVSKCDNLYGCEADRA